MSRRFFAAGSWVLVATGLVHLLGHYGMMSAEGATDAERQLLSLMRTHREDMGLGFVRSMFDLLAGFSLTFSILSVALGALGLVLLRHGSRAPGLLRQSAIVYAGFYGVMTGMALRYWFPAPILFVAITFLCFVAALATAERG